MDALNFPQRAGDEGRGPFSFTQFPAMVPIVPLTYERAPSGPVPQDLKTQLSVNPYPMRPWTPEQEHGVTNSQTKCPRVDWLPWQRELSPLATSCSIYKPRWTTSWGRLSILSLRDSPPSCHGRIFTPWQCWAEEAPGSPMPLTYNWGSTSASARAPFGSALARCARAPGAGGCIRIAPRCPPSWSSGATH